MISSNSIKPTSTTDLNKNSIEDTIIVATVIIKSLKLCKSISKNASVVTIGQSEVSEPLKRFAHKNRGTRLLTYVEEFGGTAVRGRTSNNTTNTSQNATISIIELMSSIIIIYLLVLDEA
jgi:hypothetical protein